MELKNVILTLAGTHGVSGEEQEVARRAAEIMKGWGEVRTDPLGSLICTLRAPGEGEPHLMLCAHMDEIGMIVTGILPEGFLRVSAVGGVDRRALLAAPVKVLGEEPLDGVISSIPPHLQKGEEKLPKVEELAVDVGLSYEQAQKKVRLGDRVVVSHQGGALGEECIRSKALDNRAGCGAVLYAAQMLLGEELSCGLSVVLSSREELSCGGAKTSAFGLSPTHAIAVDVSFALTDDAPKHKCGEMGKGPMIGVSPVLSKEATRDLIETAQKKKIPFQQEVMGGATSTDADVISLAGSGIRCGLVSIPLKYMHTPTEVVSLEDVKNTGRLMAEYIKETFPKRGEA